MHGKHKNSISRQDVDETEALNSELMVTPGSDPNSMVSSTASTNNSVRRRKKDEEEEENDDDKPVKDLLVYYARNSTMHGIPSIVGSKLYRGRNVFWIVIVCVMAIFLGTVVYWQMSDYYSYPTVTSIDISYVKHDDFPAITICDPNMFHQLFVDLTLDNFTMYQLAKLTEIEGFYYRFLKRVLKEEAPKPTNKSTVEYIQNLLELSYHVIDSPDNVLYCSFGNYFWTVCPASRTRVTSMGVCSTVDVRKLVQEYESANVTVPEDGYGDDGDGDGDDDDDDEENEEEMSAVGNAMRGLTLYIDTIPKDINYRLYQYQGFKLVLHDPDVEPLPQSEGVLVAGNTVVEIEVTKNVKHGLPAPYRAFGSVSCVETGDPGFQNPLQRYPNYTKEVCEHECFINFVVDFCGGCRHFLHPGNESICPLEHLSECYRDARTSYYGHSKKGPGARKRCPCLMPCRQVNYKASVSTAPFVMTQYAKDRMNTRNMSDEFSLSYVHIYFSDPVVSTMKQVAIYSAEGLLGNIGGQIGLFMGFSLVTVAEMLELIFLLVSRGRTLDENVKLHNDAHAAAQAAAQTAV